MNGDPEEPGDAEVPGVEVDHREGEAVPGEVAVPEIPRPPGFGLADREWNESQWLRLLETLIEQGIVNWKDIAAAVLGSLNPSQFGTSMASSEGFKRRYGKRKTMRVVMDWAYQQTGKCADCGSRMDLQADHAQAKETFQDQLDADFIENMVFRCRRCNVIRRPSHAHGGVTFLTAEAGLMWILFVIRPRTFEDFVRLCRLYGMTMSDIRMQEAWAMAHWLARVDPPAYGIEDEAAGWYDLLWWEDGAITRVGADGHVPERAIAIRRGVSGTAIFGFLACSEENFRFYEYPVATIPFSTYDLGDRPGNALAIKYVPPDRKAGFPPELIPLPPRNMRLIAHGVRSNEQSFRLVFGDDEEVIEEELPSSNGRGIRLGVPERDGYQLLVNH